MKINELVKKVHETAKSKGWYDTTRSPLEMHMLMVSEVAEASECARKDLPPIYAENASSIETAADKIASLGLKPEGEAVELADTIIRIADYFGSRGWDLEEVLELKMAYNLNRSYRHGNKKY